MDLGTLRQLRCLCIDMRDIDHGRLHIATAITDPYRIATVFRYGPRR